MKYQLAFYDPGPECWRYYRKDFHIVSFDSLDAAEQEAAELSKTVSHMSREILVITIHACFKTETEYPKVEPIQRTVRVPLYLHGHPTAIKEP